MTQSRSNEIKEEIEREHREAIKAMERAERVREVSPPGAKSRLRVDERRF